MEVFQTPLATLPNQIHANRSDFLINQRVHSKMKILPTFTLSPVAYQILWLLWGRAHWILRIFESKDFLGLKISIKRFLGSMMPQYMALCVSQFRLFVCFFQKNLWICSLGWVRLLVRHPLFVSIPLVTLGVRPPLVCVLSLKDNLHWILACCLLRLVVFSVKKNLGLKQIWSRIFGDKKNCKK